MPPRNDSADHGRQLQSASNFDAGSPITAETFNPTEAGSRRDGAGRTSSSRLLHLVVADGALQTTSRMAFWLAPGERSGPNPAKNRTVLSDHLLTKRVTIGYRDLPHVIQYDVTFSIPIGERHEVGVFEALTGYMPADFARFWRFNPQTEQLEPLTDGPGEQPFTVVLATADGKHAMGCSTPARVSDWPHLQGIGYGRFRFPAERVVKWNCVFRFASPAEGLAPGEYRFPIRVAVGDQETARQSLAALAAQDLDAAPAK